MFIETIVFACDDSFRHFRGNLLQRYPFLMCRVSLVIAELYGSLQHKGGECNRHPFEQDYYGDAQQDERKRDLDEDYFESLLAEIREIRLSERRFYQKITDIYATSIDYDRISPITIEFFKNVQNKMHYAISKKNSSRNYI